MTKSALRKASPVASEPGTIAKVTAVRLEGDLRTCSITESSGSTSLSTKNASLLRLTSISMAEERSSTVARMPSSRRQSVIGATTEESAETITASSSLTEGMCHSLRYRSAKSYCSAGDNNQRL